MANFTRLQSDFASNTTTSSVVRLFQNNVPIVPVSFSIDNLTPVLIYQIQVNFLESFDNITYVNSYVNNTRVRFTSAQSGVTYSLPYTSPCPPFLKLTRSFTSLLFIVTATATFSAGSTTIYFDSPLTLFANDLLTYDNYGTPQDIGYVLNSVVNVTSVQLRLPATFSATNVQIKQTVFHQYSPITFQCVS
jgi:hypothetical protein